MVTFDGRAPGTSADDWSTDCRLADLDPITLPGRGRVVVVAAHPDDETLGAGGLIAELAAAGRPPQIVVATDGSASHPGSATLPPDRLAALRADEVRRAVALLSPDSPVTLLGHRDGSVLEEREPIAAELAEICGASVATLVAPWRGDGHRDHRVLGEICAELAAQTGALLLEYPIWLWHWATPADPDVPWSHMRALPLSDRSIVLKNRAVRAHITQVRAASPAAADEAPLHPEFLRAFDRDVEVFVTAGEPSNDLPSAFFDASYARRGDPWYLATRWYERRKRAATLAAIPDDELGSVLEIGCSIGTLTVELARRCDRLVATDVSSAALAQAKERLGHLSNVDLVQHDMAEGVPGGPYDLIVLSEVGYYLTAPHLRRLASELTGALTETGTLVACHWRHPVAEYPLGGDAVHHVLRRSIDARRLLVHVEDDFVLEAWSRDPRSVASRAGLA